jgi:hypothetical protein
MGSDSHRANKHETVTSATIANRAATCRMNAQILVLENITISLKLYFSTLRSLGIFDDLLRFTQLSSTKKQKMVRQPIFRSGACKPVWPDRSGMRCTPSAARCRRKQSGP